MPRFALCKSALPWVACSPYSQGGAWGKRMTNKTDWQPAITGLRVGLFEILHGMKLMTSR